MEENNPIQYVLENGLTVELTASKSISHVTIERAVMSFYGFSEELDEQTGVAYWRKTDAAAPAFVTSRNSDLSEEEIRELAQSAGCVALDVMKDESIAQDLIKDLGLLITPLPFRDGTLVGRWRVERISSYMPWNVERNGIITGVNQPVATESVNLLHAIYATATRVMGVGKLAFVTFPKGADGEERIISCDFELVGQLEPWLNKTIFRAPELDTFITRNGKPEEFSDAVAHARAKCRAAIAE